MRRIIVILLALILVGILYTNVVRYRRINAPSPYDYTITDSIDVHYHDPAVVTNYLHQAQSLGRVARSLWQEHRIDVRFTDGLTEEELAKAEVYWKTREHVQYLELLLKQAWQWKQDGFSNPEIIRLEEGLLSPEVIVFERTYGTLTELSWSLGSVGEHIRSLQVMLVDQGYQIPIDGTYGTQTYDAVMEVQRQNGLLITGFPNLKTLSQIFNHVNE